MYRSCLKPTRPAARTARMSRPARARRLARCGGGWCVGPFIAGGALFAALTGAVTGAVVGGIAAALIDFSGIPEEEARGYESDIRNGKTLVAVKARDEDAAAVQQILTSSGADGLRGDQ